MGADQSQNAMTEIALALAMAFFAIMVLAMISMGAGVISEQSKKDSAEPIIRAADIQDRAPPTDNDGSTEMTAEDRIVIHWQGNFFDEELASLPPENISQHVGRVILALDPSLAMEKALEARSLLQHDNLIVSTLDQAWLDRLRRITP